MPQIYLFAKSIYSSNWKPHVCFSKVAQLMPMINRSTILPESVIHSDTKILHSSHWTIHNNPISANRASCLIDFPANFNHDPFGQGSVPRPNEAWHIPGVQPQPPKPHVRNSPLAMEGHSVEATIWGSINGYWYTDIHIIKRTTHTIIDPCKYIICILDVYYVYCEMCNNIPWIYLDKSSILRAIDIPIWNSSFWAS